MSRNTVTITDTTLSVEPHGLDKMWSYTSRLEFPLACEGVRACGAEPLPG